ncbi:MAG: NAD(P)/FAD-dependent oxidoreductase, partial [Acidobacteriota bacterium]
QAGSVSLHPAAAAIVAIVGAGPAGAAVSEVLSGAGVPHHLFDEQPRTGGNLDRCRFDAPPTPLEDNPLCRWHAGTRVLRVSPRLEVEWDDGATLQRQAYDAVFLCAGAFDGMLPRAGSHATWSSAGALQALLKGQGIVPAGRVLICGSGPFLHIAAADLVRAGAQVAAVVDAMPLSAYGKLLRWSRWDNMKVMLGAHLALRGAGAALHFGARVAELECHRATLADGTRIAFDHAGITDFFCPQTQLARSAGCTQAWSRTGHYFFTPVDADYRSSARNVFVCGEGAGVRGGEHARLSGLIASLAYLGDLNIAAPMQRAALQRKAQNLARFGPALEAALAAHEPRPADDAWVCACERVSAGAVRQAVAYGLEDLSSIKIVTRCGMGTCQGRYCEPLVGRLIEAAGATPRAPLNQKGLARPLAVKELIGG